ncbi:MAG: ABC transporter ATP-binding protein [Lachnospiraceae bacterium]|nr:ABC transporter ATP-binding protein [Lachnospiraceae bacterium]
MLKILKNLTKKEWSLAALALVFIVAQVWLDLTMPDYMSEITILVQTPGSEMSEILTAGGKMLLCALGSLIASVLTILCAARIGSNLSYTLRRQLFGKVQEFSMEEIGHFSTASLITRSTNDITQVQMLIIMGLEMLLKAPIKAVWAVCKIAGKDWHWTLATGIAVAALLILVGLSIVIVLPKFKKLQVLTDDLNRVTRENLNGLRVVRAYNAEKYQEKKFEGANAALTGTSLFAQRTMSFMMPGIQLIMSGLSLAVYWIGAVLINNAGMTEKLTLFSDMMVFSQYAMQVVSSFMMLVMIFMMLPRASVAAKRINEVLDTEPTIHDGYLTQGSKELEGEVEFRNVSFRYPDAEEYVLKDISFRAAKGETVAFIGSTGCGKSTVINLIPRFYDATEGQVLVDGVNVKGYTQQALRNKIGYVSQKATLFTGTIRSNVAFGDNGRPEAEMQENVEEAIATAQASEFVENLSEGYDGYVAQGGTNLSGGQKQRISIARAICRKPEILIFDDSFSALDYKTDRRLRETLNEKCGDATRLIVAQRIGTIRDADKIIVLDEGRMAGIGTHEELMQNCEVYRQIAYSQLSKEELA